MADSEDLQAKVGKENTGDTLVALGAAHGCEVSIEDVQASVELSDDQMEGVSGGVVISGTGTWLTMRGGRFSLKRIERPVAPGLHSVGDDSQ